MLLFRTAIVFRSPLLKRLDQIFRQVTYYELCHRSLRRRRIRQLYRFDSPGASIDSSRLKGLGSASLTRAREWRFRLNS
jgi:hypothetical protein